MMGRIIPTAARVQTLVLGDETDGLDEAEE